MCLLCFSSVPATPRRSYSSSVRARQTPIQVTRWRKSTVTTANSHRKHHALPKQDASNPANIKSFKDVKLILAPMEVLADHQFRKAIATIGGMDEAVHEFLRITHPELGQITGVLGSRYNAKEMGNIPLAAQIMGGDPAAMEMAAWVLAHRHSAHRVDLNCGCPAKKVNGRGAGASLLRTPEAIYEITKRMVGAVEGSDAVVSVKMRSGYDSTALFDENIHAVMEAGARMLTVHPRTKTQGYSGKADWEFIKRAKEICGYGLEVVGNGDVTTAQDAVRMLDYTGCDHVMVGRGAVANPWMFWDIREAFAEQCGRFEMDLGARNRYAARRTPEAERRFFECYFRSGGEVDDRSSPKMHKMKIGRLKMVIGYSSTVSEQAKKILLRSDGGGDARAYLEEVLDVIDAQYTDKMDVVAR